MIENYIYILVDEVSNHVLSRGLGLAYLQRSMKKKPQNLLVLSCQKDYGQADDHTHFKLIRGERSVQDFLSGQSRLAFPDTKWVDYYSQELLHQLTPGEIAELLYLGHVNRHLHSPFFYKLQNNYVFLPMANGILKTYYRDVKEFYFQLANVIRDKLLAQRPERRSLFGWRSHNLGEEAKIPLPPMAVMQEIRPLLTEGVIFDFSQLTWREDQAMAIPLLLAEDQVDDILQRKQTVLLAKLSYSMKDKKWAFERIADANLFGG